MGKSKNNKRSVKSNIFKVAGCKSLKAKIMAKEVTADRLKQVKLREGLLLSSLAFVFCFCFLQIIQHQ